MTAWQGSFVGRDQYRSFRIAGPDGAVTFDLRLNPLAVNGTIVDEEGCWDAYDLAVHWHTRRQGDHVMPACEVTGGVCYYVPDSMSARYLAQRWARARFDDNVVWQELADAYEARRLHGVAV